MSWQTSCAHDDSACDSNQIRSVVSENEDVRERLYDQQLGLRPFAFINRRFYDTPG